MTFCSRRLLHSQAMVQCPICERTFTESAMQSHARSCRPGLFKKGNQKPSARAVTPDPKAKAGGRSGPNSAPPKSGMTRANTSRRAPSKSASGGGGGGGRIFCTQCGTSLGAEHMFCFSCGAKRHDGGGGGAAQDDQDEENEQQGEVRVHTNSKVKMQLNDQELGQTGKELFKAAMVSQRTLSP